MLVVVKAEKREREKERERRKEKKRKEKKRKEKKKKKKREEKRKKKEKKRRCLFLLMNKMVCMMRNTAHQEVYIDCDTDKFAPCPLECFSCEVESMTQPNVGFVT